VANAVPAFLERRVRRAKIIAVTDVNSGDGKTALVSQLGAMLAAQGDQVLMLDMDYRGALTESCFAPDVRQRLRANGRTVVRWLESAGRRGRPLLECMARVSDNLWAVAYDESLGVWEARERAAWLVQREPYDVRFRLRGELHGTDICQRFDWILIDCSRRLSTAAINAFTSSDYLLLAGPPQTAEAQASSQAQVGQLLGWLARLNVLTGACRGLSMLGVVGVGEGPNGIQSTDIALPASISGAAALAGDRLGAASPSRGDRWADGVYYFGNSVPRVAVKEFAPREAVAAGPRSRVGATTRAVQARGAHLTGLAREMKQRIAARGKRR
jgi:cellulose biosynthesis protein BcsQ